MGDVNVDYIKPGMLLADDLKDANGRFLLGRGTVIQEKHIRIMKMWGITSADIEGVDQERAAQEELSHIEPELLKKIQTYVNAIFSEKGSKKANEHEAIREIKRLRILRLARRIMSGVIQVTDLESGSPGNFEFDSPLSQEKEEILPVHQLVEKSIQLASFPDIYYRIVEMLNDIRSSATKLAQVVSSDPGLSATLLKLVNSAFYGLPSRVSSITRAIALIGGKELTTLAMGISVIRYFKDIPPQMIDMKKFWMHSIAVGVFARILAQQRVGLVEEEFFIAGLLHDIGRLVAFKEFPRTAAKTILNAREKHSPLYLEEKGTWGYDHTAAAGLLVQKWNFPEPLRQMIKFHHNPLTSPEPLDASIIYLADMMATAHEFGYSGNSFIAPFDGKIWDTVELSPSVLSPSLDQADRQVNEILRTFSLDRK